MEKQSTRLCLGIFAGAALVVARAGPASAHHGWGGNETEETELTGTVEMPRVPGPHATLQVRVG